MQLEENRCEKESKCVTKLVHSYSTRSTSLPLHVCVCACVQRNYVSNWRMHLSAMGVVFTIILVSSRNVFFLNDYTHIIILTHNPHQVDAQWMGLYMSANDQKLVTTLLRDINTHCYTSNAFHDAFKRGNDVTGLFFSLSQSIKR